MPKRPRSAFSPVKHKTPRIATTAVDYNAELVRWRTADVDFTGPFGWENICREELLKDVLVKLHDLGTQKFSDCIGRDKPNHSIPIADLCSDAQKRLVEIGKDVFDELVSIRLSGAKRVWAVRDRAVLHLLWWDPEHKVYPVEKKHT